MALAGVVILVPVGLMLALICLLAGAAVVLSIPEAMVQWVRRHRRNHRTG